jgi:hypothetical protein
MCINIKSLICFNYLSVLLFHFTHSDRQNFMKWKNPKIYYCHDIPVLYSKQLCHEEELFAFMQPRFG